MSDRKAIVLELLRLARVRTEDDLMDALQLGNLSPGCVSDCAVHLADVPTGDLARALAMARGESREQMELAR